MTQNTSKTKQLPDYDQALTAIWDEVFSLPAERVPVGKALGRKLYEDVVADRDQPPFDRSAMDGFAVRTEELGAGRSWPVSGVIAAGAASHTFTEEMAVQTVKRIATGAPLANGADAVIPIEQANVQAKGESEEVSFTLDTLKPWANVHRQGADALAGDVVIKARTLLSAAHIGIASAVGATSLSVMQQPRITLLTTGDEVKPTETPTEQLQRQQIRNSNGPMLQAMLQSLGLPPATHHHLPDEPDATCEAARKAISESDLVITTGGISVGQRDWLPSTWQKLGAQTIVHGIAIQPGKPVLVARSGKTLIVGLPGNPVSVLATAHLFLWPILTKMAGCQGPQWRQVLLGNEVKAKAKRQVFRAASIDDEGHAQVIVWQGSGDLMHTANAQGWVRLPRTDEIVKPNTPVWFLPMVQR